ncbi:ABC transporter permease [Gynuella sunshinyii]|uniref:ABC-type transport system, involved in lipoprotein release, permease component n=1 Tax=Gynuella sunshinyii YC6258 TaxID=1445510 RepID=A0A0C5UXQ5_9GAMM|nr:FtsX-like permease family protein [Gynuella sunshinyii]AJQ92090.1 ABC-type transport system, involved in lipoprotein release, permease component [Gynuella sunshinyii YC6258]
MQLIWKLSLRNILRNPKRSLLTALLISCSLAALIFTDGYIIGLSQDMIKSATRLFPGDGQIHHPEYLAGYEADNRLTDPGLIQQLRQRPEVEAATERAISAAMIASTGNVRSVQMIGIDATSEAQVSKITQSIIEGAYLTGANPQEILLGYRLASKMEVSLGDKIVLSVPQVDGGDISQNLFRVSGIFRFNSKAMDENMVFINLGDAQRMLNQGTDVQEIAFNFHDPALASQDDLPLWQAFSGDRSQAQGWPHILPQLSSMLGMMDYSLALMGTILFIIAALGVINAMFMSIYERMWEFGVIKAIGTTPQNIFLLILVEGLLLALLSVIIGLILGLGINSWIGVVGIDYSQMEFSGVALVEPTKTIIRPLQYTQLPLWVVGLTLLACIYPALFAARIVPTQALHKSL